MPKMPVHANDWNDQMRARYFQFYTNLIVSDLESRYGTMLLPHLDALYNPFLDFVNSENEMEIMLVTF